MIWELSAAHLITLAVGAIVGHILLVIASRWVNPLYVLATVILVLAPFSAAPELTYVVGQMVKWTRGYALVLLLLLGVLRYRGGAPGPASMVWAAFYALYILGALWSHAPHYGILYKGQTGLVVIAGFLMAYSVRNRGELLAGLRFAAMAGAVLGLTVLMAFVTNPQAVVKLGRVNLLGVLPTRIAANAAPLALISIYLALNERAGRWKTVAYVCSTLLVLATVITGSRGPVGVVVLGFLIQLMPGSGRRLRMFLLPVFVGGVAFIFLDAFGSELQVSRLASTENTRAEVWAKAAELVEQMPVLGHGWVSRVRGTGAAGLRPTTTANMHSMFMQVAVELGAVGLAIFICCLAFVAFRGLHMYRFVRRYPTHAHLAVLPITLVVSALVIGIVENNALTPSSFALVLALGIGLFDSLPGLVARERWRVRQTVRAAMARRRYPGGAGLAGAGGGV